MRRLEDAAAKAVDENGNCNSSSITNKRKENDLTTVVDADRDWSISPQFLSMANDVIACPIVVDVMVRLMLPLLLTCFVSIIVVGLLVIPFHQSFERKRRSFSRSRESE